MNKCFKGARFGTFTLVKLFKVDHPVCKPARLWEAVCDCSSPCSFQEWELTTMTDTKGGYLECKLDDHDEFVERVKAGEMPIYCDICKLSLQEEEQFVINKTIGEKLEVCNACFDKKLLTGNYSVVFRGLCK